MADAVPDLASLDFASVTPQEFAVLVKRTPAKELAAFLRGEPRARVLAEVFGRMECQFRPENAGSLDTVIRWRITGADGEPEAVYETAISGGRCTVREGASDAEPRVTLTMTDTEFLRLVSGNGNPVTMFMTRKLKVSGDIGLASGLTRLFDIPKA